MTTPTGFAYNPLINDFAEIGNKPLAELVHVSPSQAQTWLVECNTKNRPLQWKVVQRYAADMVNRQWLVTGNGPRFSRDGVLIDGQHTLCAITVAKVPVEMMVFFNLDPEAQRNVDDQRKRSYKDHLSLRGEQNAGVLASVVRRSLLFAQGTYGPVARREPTKSELDVFLSYYHQALTESARVAQSLSRVLTIGPAVAGTAHFVLSGIDPWETDVFMSRLRDGVNLASDSPILVLRDRLMRARQDRVRTDSLEVLAWFMRAWNGHRSGRPMKLVRQGSDYKFPLPTGYTARPLPPGLKGATESEPPTSAGGSQDGAA